MSKTTFASLSREITTEAQAYAYLEGLRWGDTPRCSHCQGTNVYLMQPRNGVSRATRTGAQSERRVWRCRECRKQFSVLTGTIMQSTKIPVRVWVLVYFEFMASKNGMSAREVERKYGICPRSAWFMLHRIREAMRWDYTDRFQGVVVADETYVGGHPKNRHAWQRVERDGRGTDKAPVVSILNDETGEVRSHVTERVDAYTLGQIIAGNVDWEGSTLVTDSWKGYGPVGQGFAKHEWVDHSAGEYVRDGYTTNRLECFFSQFKRSLTGTHHQVSRKHLHRFAEEHDFRYSTCKATDTERMAALLRQVDGRLTYTALTGR